MLMEYYQIIDDKFVYTTINKITNYKIKDRNKFAGKEIDIPITRDYEINFLNAIEKDKKVIFWEYKKIDIPYVKADNTIDNYKPCYHVIFKDGDKLKVNIFDVEEYQPIKLSYLTDEELDDMTESEAVIYMNMLDEEQNIINKYTSAKKYCKLNGMDFFIIDQTGIKNFVADEIVKYN